MVWQKQCQWLQACEAPQVQGEGCWGIANIYQRKRSRGFSILMLFYFALLRWQSDDHGLWVEVTQFLSLIEIELAANTDGGNRIRGVLGS